MIFILVRMILNFMNQVIGELERNLASVVRAMVYVCVAGRSKQAVCLIIKCLPTHR